LAAGIDAYKVKIGCYAPSALHIQHQAIALWPGSCLLSLTVRCNDRWESTGTAARTLTQRKTFLLEAQPYDTLPSAVHVRSNCAPTVRLRVSHIIDISSGSR